MELPRPSGSRLGRREALRAAVLLPLAASLSTACTSTGPPPPDPLQALVTRARSDAALAEAVAQTHQSLAAKAHAVAGDRSQHAGVLLHEVQRVNPPDPKQPPPAAPPVPQVPASETDAHTALVQALRAAQQQAADLVVGLPPYRAGIVGSVSASCGSLLEVLM